MVRPRVSNPRPPALQSSALKRHENEILLLNPIQTGEGWGGGGGGFWCPRQLWRFVTSKPLKLWPPNLATFPKIYLQTFRHQFPLSINFDVSMATIYWQACFTKLRFFSFLMGNFQFFNVISTLLHHLSVSLLIFISFWLIWTVLRGFGEIWKSKIEDQYGRRLEIMT